MSSSTVSLLIWIVLMVALVLVMAIRNRHGKRIDRNVEEVASDALPTIGAIAERRHEQRLGRPATGPSGGNWYPPIQAANARRKPPGD